MSLIEWWDGGENSGGDGVVVIFIVREREIEERERELTCNGRCVCFDHHHHQHQRFKHGINCFFFFFFSKFINLMSWIWRRRVTETLGRLKSNGVCWAWRELGWSWIMCIYVYVEIMLTSFLILCTCMGHFAPVIMWVIIIFHAPNHQHLQPYT